MLDAQIERFKVHKNDSKRNKFSREEYWIKEMDSYHNGYNMNLGGKSKKVLDYKKIIDLYKNTNENQKTIALECDCSTDSVKNIVSLYIDKPE